MLRLFRLIKQKRAIRRVEAMRRPDPDYLVRRLAQFSPERRERYFENIRKAGLHD